MGERMGTQGMGQTRDLSNGGGDDQAQEQAQNDDQNGGQNEPYQHGAGGGRSQQQQRVGQTHGQMGQRQRLSFNAEAECTQLVQRDQNSGRLTIGLSNCHAEMQF